MAVEFNALDEGVFDSEVRRIAGEFPAGVHLEIHVSVPSYGVGWVRVRGSGFDGAAIAMDSANRLKQFFSSAMEQIEGLIEGAA